MISFRRTAFIALFLSALCADCADGDQIPRAAADGGGTSDGPPGNDSAPAADAGSDGNANPAPSPVEAVPLMETIHASSLSAPIDIVRDEWGIPHVYGETLADVTFGQGYIVARDRFVQMDLARHQASGTIAELAGSLSPSAIDGDVAIRAHHLRKTATDGFTALKASTDPKDQAIVASIGSFAAGVNAYLDDVRLGRATQAVVLSVIDDFSKAAPWTEIDSLAVGELEAFDLAFDAASEIDTTMMEAKAAIVFDTATDPTLLARKGIASDLRILAPFDPTYTISGWTGLDAALELGPTPQDAANGNWLELLRADLKTVTGLGNDHRLYPSRGSNNWIVGPSLSATGHTIVANDTHLSLGNPSTFYLVHLSARGGAIPVNVMGAAFPGIPGIILGMNDHVAWGATVSNIDATDVYEETVVTCDDGTSPCVVFKGAKVPLAPRVEKFNVGGLGTPLTTYSLTLYDVPHHGPIIPRVTRTHDGLEALGTTELSIRYTGHQAASLARAQIALDASANMGEAVAALERDFKYGGQNWVIGDDQGNFGWTEAIRAPRRAPGHAPWKVLPGDGSAEWGADLDMKYIPHAYNPPEGFLATANNDPIGVTDDGDPFFDEPMVDGAPLYLGWAYDPGTREGRIAKRINALKSAGKVSVADVQSIQADAFAEWGRALLPVLLDAATSLNAELATPGTHPELSSIATGASTAAKKVLPDVIPLLSGWTFDTPSGAAEDAPTPQQIADSQATLVTAWWVHRFYEAALSDELAKLDADLDSSYALKLLTRAATHPDLLKSGIDATTHDPSFFDDLTTPAVESRRQIAVKALATALDEIAKKLGDTPATWRWGQVHTLTISFAVSFLDALKIPRPDETTFPGGFPRHGYYGTVDVGAPSSRTDYSYHHGPAIRFVCDLDPATGPHAKNALPGGEIFDPTSPHYRDQMELWRKNKTFDLAFSAADVVASAIAENAKNKLGRIHMTP